MVSISLPACLRDESCLVWPFLSELLLLSVVLVPPKVKGNKLSLRNEPFCMSALSACLLSFARCSSSFLCFCRRACIRREQLILNMVTILDISAFSSALFLICSTPLGSGCFFSEKKKKIYIYIYICIKLKG